MKKIILLFIFLCLSTIVYLSFPLSNTKHFVSIKDHTFILDDQPFYPIALNYIVTMQGDKDGNIWPSSFNGYNPGERYQYTTKDSCMMQLKAEIDLIKEMGFNRI